MNIPQIITSPNVNAILQWIIVVGIVASFAEPYATKWPNVYDLLSRLAGLGGDVRKAVGGGTGSSGRAVIATMANEDDLHSKVIEDAAKIVTNNLEVPPPPNTPTLPGPKAPSAIVLSVVVLLAMIAFAATSATGCAALQSLPPKDVTLVEIDAEKLACALAQTGLDTLDLPDAAAFLESVCGLSASQAKLVVSSRKMSMSIAPAAHPTTVNKPDAGPK